MDKENVVVSLCAFGVVCRYHGRSHKMGHMLYKEKKTEELRVKYNVIPLCGEIMGGLPTPRPPCNVLNEKVIGRYDGIDYTEQYQKGANEVLRLAQIFNVKKAFLLKDSPMCGKDYGILAKLLEKNGIKVYNI
ncbi:DUF523 domain-containing protein [Methanosarcina sp. UBA5]|uniref:DUF523 domain-containing protein n=1 Tax=Methanosarcina sp. UBA5 TaxID=1915593 RepID=UPI0025FA1785|nr:DUF523 domain-containing protein [Methanosarcina sp. UBA5]